MVRVEGVEPSMAQRPTGSQPVLYAKLQHSPIVPQRPLPDLQDMNQPHPIHDFKDTKSRNPSGRGGRGSGDHKDLVQDSLDHRAPPGRLR